MSKDEELEKIRQKKLRQLERKSKETTTSEGILMLTDSTFDTTIKNTSKPILVDFWAEWCMPCRMMAPVIEELARDYAEKAVFAKINVDENPETAARFNVTGIPSFIIFKNGQPVEQMIGACGRKPLEEAVKKHLAT